MRLLEEPLLTVEMQPEALMCEAGSLYLHSNGPEERSLMDHAWMRSQPQVTFAEVEGIEPDDLRFLGETISVRDKARLAAALEDKGSIYIDITGMTYSMWAPLVGAALSAPRCHVLYREPLDYRRSENPARGMIYDLSERIAGIAPLPGMASIRLRAPAESVLVPLLGFEGARFAHVLESTEPVPERVVPIIGAPGFRAEYTAQTLLSNRPSLEIEGHHSRIQYAKANCPFDLFHELVKVAENFGNPFLRIAPVGTKPHGLGAILYALARPGRAEIVYDHPTRKERRTTGLSRLCIYDVSTFAESDLFRGTGPYA